MSSSVAAIIACCSGLKRALPASDLMQHALPRGTQAAVQNEWLRRLSVTSPLALTPARELYRGRSVQRLDQSATKHDASLFIISAGLGFIPAKRLIPSYDLTLSEDAPTSIRDQIEGQFEPALWWDAVVRGRFSESARALPGGKGRILIALSKPYATLVNQWLASLDSTVVSRLRLFGSGLIRCLPSTLAAQYIDYDLRLDAIQPGTRHDFASRALAHFSELITSVPTGNVSNDQRLVCNAMEGASAPMRPLRDRMADDQLTLLVTKLANANLTMGQALSKLRDSFGVACGENRFRRIFEEVSS
jgi:hypothetical protein